MKHIPNNNIVAFDCDDTLVLWDRPDSTHTLEGSRYKMHHKHITSLKRFHARGQFVIVWSAGGAEWAKKVVKLLNLEKYVDLTLSKPRWMFDDQPLSRLGDRCFITEEV